VVNNFYSVKLIDDFRILFIGGSGGLLNLVGNRVVWISYSVAEVVPLS